MTTSPLWSLDIVKAVQGWGDWLTPPMQMFTLIGSVPFFLLLICLVLWCIDKPLGTDLGALLLLSGFSNGVIKAALKWPRPFWLDPALGRAAETTYSLPSGHSQAAVMMFGYLAAMLWCREGRHRRWAGLLIMLIPFIALSRVYLGVHFPGDVLAGLAIGLGLLGLYLRLRAGVAAWLGSLTITAHAGLACAASGLSLGLPAFGLAIPLAGAHIASAIDSMARRATVDDASALAGMILGLWVGLAVETRYLGFTVAGTPGQRAIRCLLGLIGLIVLWWGVGALWAGETGAVSILLSVLRYAAVALWVAVAWPWLFVRIGLGALE